MALMNTHMGPRAMGLALPQTTRLNVNAPPERITALHAIRDRHPGGTASTQRACLLDALQSMGYVTTFEAMRYLDIFDPRPRKLELVREGWQIATAWATVETESGRHHRIGVYSLGTRNHGFARQPKEGEVPTSVSCDSDLFSFGALKLPFDEPV